MIGTRIRQARLAAGLSLDALVEKGGGAYTELQEYEKASMIPHSSQLLKLARACGVRIEYFMRTHAVELLDPEFRRRAAFRKDAREVLKMKVVGAVEQRVELLGFFPEAPIARFKAPQELPQQIDDLDELEAFADRVRQTWELGLGPIDDLADTLETLGLLVIVVDEADPGFSGLTATACVADGRTYPVVAVSSRWPGDWQRFTLVHGLGQLLLAHIVTPGARKEKACDRFAGAFLAPKAAVVRSLGPVRRGVEWQELLALKHAFGLSMAGWLQRARQCGVTTEAVHSALSQDFFSNGWRQSEPGEPVPREHSRLFGQLVYRALGEGYVSESKAAELLGIPRMLLHKKRQLEALDAAHQ
ncbi:XRE family transcriptional regulator [Verminephrobacter aporrectodeae]|uniref:XRE family transcriptional regulator n=1 Tax=Verminephrobacter aporrectodeae TaxID=1110389 RepID=UPI002237301B|nr:XRE family transcriptional regulator [Verminephrobacter aporrectodeae]MCW5256761.1 helix-turn-helix domain-containing protein [Verminephrobacter aporrectodeae subsp. tuberculatae]MCW8174186.1 helix-turn-helix domain-containing protein [Verminephrobacter aporrectodeae subsp. tuberculatae]MCW8201845.1 helix-turn-helix domain-containing protein [Verminephrobacter aporrectodeae subsp. tuberculatae]